MAIIRTRLDFESEFTRIPNEWVRDGDLSLKARGLLALLMSHRPGWRISKAALVAGNPEGREAIEGALRELRKAGYLKVAPARDESTGRMRGQDWVLSLPDRDTENPYYGQPTPKKTNHQEEQEKRTSKSQLSLRRAERFDDLATEAQVRYVRDAYILANQELPDEVMMGEFRAMTQAQVKEEIDALWREVEFGGEWALLEARDQFGAELSDRAHHFIERKLAG